MMAALLFRCSDRFACTRQPRGAETELRAHQVLLYYTSIFLCMEWVSPSGCANNFAPAPNMYKYIPLTYPMEMQDTE